MPTTSSAILDSETEDCPVPHPTSKSSGNRRVAIRDHLAKYMSGRDAGALFTSRHGQRISRRQAQRRFTQWRRKAGITRAASPHSCRHRFALSITSTLVYVQADEERLRRALG